MSPSTSLPFRRQEHLTPTVLLAVTLAVSAAGSAPVLASAEDDAFESSILGKLKSRNPEAAAIFRQANEAREREDFEEASRLYARTAELEPSFYHANRRRCLVETDLGHREAALDLCQRALDARDSAYNHVAMAVALSFAPEGESQDEAELQKALDHALRASQLEPDDYFVQATLCQVAVDLPRPDILEGCAASLEVIAPEDPLGYLLSSIHSAMFGALRKAKGELEEAHRRGLPEESYQELLEAYEEATPLWVRWAPTGLGVGSAWLAGFALLLGAGFALSSATLRSVRRLPADPREGTTEGGSLRKSYRAVLWLCCAYYYISIPLVLLTVLGAGAASIYALLSAQRIRIKLVIGVLVVVVGTLYAVIESLLVRDKDEDPGPEIDLEKHPRLKGVVEEVARKVGTPAVDHVYITPGTQVAVFERGGILQQIRGAAGRCLILGAGVLPDLDVSRLKAILAHEYGHLNNKDTAGGGFALAVRRSLNNMALGLAQSGTATWYSPAWWFVSGFYRIFLRISQGASRLQEIMADRWAVACYGPSAFIEGLRTVVASGVRFDIKVNDVINESIRTQRPVENLYAARPEKELDRIYIEGEIEDALNAEPSPYASHPSPSERFELVRALSVEEPPPVAGEDEGAWSLFEGREALEKQLTLIVKAAVVDQHGQQVLL